MVHRRNQGRNRAQEREENLQGSQVKQKNTMNNTRLYNLRPAKLKSKLTKRVVTYANEGESTVKADGIRTFLVEGITQDGMSIEGGRRFVKAITRDLDDGGERKYRTLHVAGITKVSGRIGTAIRMIKTLF